MFHDLQGRSVPGGQGQNGELIVGTAERVWKTRTVHHKPFDDRWEKDNAEMIKGAATARGSDGSRHTGGVEGDARCV